MLDIIIKKGYCLSEDLSILEINNYNYGYEVLYEDNQGKHDRVIRRSCYKEAEESLVSVIFRILQNSFSMADDDIVVIDYFILNKTILGIESREEHYFKDIVYDILGAERKYNAFDRKDIEELRAIYHRTGRLYNIIKAKKEIVEAKIKEVIREVSIG